jgi:mRNA interferase MazF
VLVVQADEFNRSAIATVVVVITSNLRLAEAPGNVRLEVGAAGLDRKSVANFSQLLTLDRKYLDERAGALPTDVLRRVEAGLQLVLGLAPAR